MQLMIFRLHPTKINVLKQARLSVSFFVQNTISGI